MELNFYPFSGFDKNVDLDDDELSDLSESPKLLTSLSRINFHDPDPSQLLLPQSKFILPYDEAEEEEEEYEKPASEQERAMEECAKERLRKREKEREKERLRKEKDKKKSKPRPANPISFIYFSPAETRKIILVQSCCRKFLAIQSIPSQFDKFLSESDGTLSAEMKASKQRMRIVREILSTEKTYVNNLEILIDNFMVPLQTAPGMTQTDHNSIFASIESIANLNGMLFKSLQRHFVSGIIGKIFLDIIPYLKMYISYINNYSNAIATLGKLQKNPAFQAFLKELESNPKAADLKFCDYLITPIQRIPRYVLLFQTLINNTDKSHMDYPNLSKLLVQLQESATLINERKRQQEDMQRMINLQSEISGECPLIVKPSRRFIRDGQAKKSHSSRVDGEERHLYLFNDIIMCVYQPPAGKQNSKPYCDFLLFLSDVQAFAVTGSEFNYNLLLRYGVEKFYLTVKGDWLPDIKKHTEICKLQTNEEREPSYVRQHGALGRSLKRIKSKTSLFSFASSSGSRIRSISSNSNMKTSARSLKAARDPSRDMKRGYLKHVEIFPSSGRSKKTPEHKRRWIVLQTNLLLFFFEDEQNQLQLNAINIEEASINENDSNPEGFQIETSESTHNFLASNRIEAKLWVSTLQEATRNFNNLKKMSSSSTDLIKDAR